MKKQELILVLWDIDGTLMFCGADGTVALNRTFRELYDVDAAFQKVGVGRAMDNTHVHRIMEREGIPEEDYEKIKAVYARILDEVLAADPDKRRMAGAEELVTALKQQEHVMQGLLTSNFRIGAERKLKSVGMFSWFSFGGFGDLPGEKWHAAAAAVKEAEMIAGESIRTENVWLIGDGTYDIATARRIGAHSVAVSTGWTSAEDLKKEEPDYFFPDLTFRDAILGAILGR